VFMSVVVSSAAAGEIKQSSPNTVSSDFILSPTIVIGAKSI
jgi:hypothetical protein